MNMTQRHSSEPSSIILPGQLSPQSSIQADSTSQPYQPTCQHVQHNHKQSQPIPCNQPTAHSKAHVIHHSQQAKALQYAATRWPSEAVQTQDLEVNIELVPLQTAQIAIRDPLLPATKSTWQDQSLRKVGQRQYEPGTLSEFLSVASRAQQRDFQCLKGEGSGSEHGSQDSKLWSPKQKQQAVQGGRYLRLEEARCGLGVQYSFSGHDDESSGPDAASGQLGQQQQLGYEHQQQQELVDGKKHQQFIPQQWDQQHQQDQQQQQQQYQYQQQQQHQHQEQYSRQSSSSLSNVGKLAVEVKRQLSECFMIAKGDILGTGQYQVIPQGPSSSASSSRHTNTNESAGQQLAQQERQLAAQTQSGGQKLTKLEEQQRERSRMEGARAKVEEARKREEANRKACIQLQQAEASARMRCRKQVLQYQPPQVDNQGTSPWISFLGTSRADQQVMAGSSIATSGWKYQSLDSEETQ